MGSLRNYHFNGPSVTCDRPDAAIFFLCIAAPHMSVHDRTSKILHRSNPKSGETSLGFVGLGRETQDVSSPLISLLQNHQNDAPEWKNLSEPLARSESGRSPSGDGGSEDVSDTLLSPPCTPSRRRAQLLIYAPTCRDHALFGNRPLLINVTTAAGLYI